MLSFNYIFIAIIIIALGILYQRFIEKSSRTANFDEYHELRKYFLSDKKVSLLSIHVNTNFGLVNLINFFE